MVAMGARTIGGSQAMTAAALYHEATSVPDESLFDGVDGLQEVGSGPATSAVGAMGGSGEAELAAAAAASLVVSRDGMGIEPMDD